MKKITPILSMIVCLSSVSAFADGDALIFVDYSVAKSVIEKHFGHFTQNMPEGFQTEYDDETILKIAIQEYSDMLRENDGFVSAEGIVTACQNTLNTISDPVKPPQNDYTVTNTYSHASVVTQSATANSTVEVDHAVMTGAIAGACVNFITDLVNTPYKQPDGPNCEYDITEVRNQFHLKYTNKKTGHGFIRHCNNYVGWRNFNPGNLKGSSLKCASSGGFAVFESEEKGYEAAFALFRNSYNNSTIRDAVPKYAPKKDNNNPEKYVSDLEGMDVNVDRVVSSFSDEELMDVLTKIAILEGWNNGKKACNDGMNYVSGNGVEYF